MNNIITSRLVVAASLCPRKAYFLLRGEPDPRPHEYDQIVEQRAERNRAKFLSSQRLDESGMIVVGDLAADCDAVEKPSRTALPQEEECQAALGFVPGLEIKLWPQP